MLLFFVQCKCLLQLEEWIWLCVFVDMGECAFHFRANLWCPELGMNNSPLETIYWIKPHISL